MMKRFYGTTILAALALQLGTGCVPTRTQVQSTDKPGSRQIELQVAGATLVAQDEPSPVTTSQATQEAQAASPVQEKPKAEEKKDIQPAQGDSLEMRPGETSIQGTQEESVSPFDPDAVYLATIKSLIPDNRPITIERSDMLTVPQLLEAIAKFGQFNIAVADGLDDLKISRVNFPNIPLRDAFIAILKRYRLNLTRIGNVLWIDKGNLAGDQMVYRVLRLSSISATSLSSQLGQILSGNGGASGASAGSGSAGGSAGGVQGVSTANGFFTIHPDSNTIFIRAKPEMVDAMSKFINAVDFQGRQVMIEMKIFEVSVDDINRQGAALSVTDYFTANKNNKGDFLSDFLFTDLGTDPKTLLDELAPGDEQVGPDASKTGFLFRFRGGTEDRVQGFFDFIKTFSTVDLLSSPRIVAYNGKQAEINIIDKIPYVETTNTPGSAGVTTTETVKFEEVGIKLKVTPTIQEDKRVRLAVEPEVSEEKEKFKDIPVIVKRTSKTEVVVRDGEPFAIGGLIKNQVKHQEAKVPLLGDIPLLGRLFRRDEDTVKKLELLILITPRIIQDDGTASSMSESQINSLEQFRNTLKKNR